MLVLSSLPFPLLLQLRTTSPWRALPTFRWVSLSQLNLSRNILIDMARGASEVILNPFKVAVTTTVSR